MCTHIPLQFVDDDARMAGNVNPEYSQWLQKDQMLLSWLQSTLSTEILSRVLGCTHSHQLWDRLFGYFQKQTRARARQLRVELRALTVDNSSVQEYRLKVRNIVDSLASIGDPIPHSHHIDVVLEGLPAEFASVVSVIESKFGCMDLDEVEILLLAHELHLNKFKKASPPDLISLNLTHTTPNSVNLEEAQSTSVEPSLAQPSSSPMHQEQASFRGGYRGSHGGRNGRGRGRFPTSTVQCQVCSKFGHTALASWYRFNQSFTPVASSAFVANSIPAASASWFPDSGAFFHVTSDAKNLQQLTPFESPDQIYMGNGQGLHIQSSGSSVFTSPIHPHTLLTFHNLIPTITKNLLSVSQFCRDNNVYFLFDANKCLVLSQVNNDVLLEGQVGKDGLYELPSLTLLAVWSSLSLCVLLSLLLALILFLLTLVPQMCGI